MVNRRRSIRDIPLASKQRKVEDALQWREEPIVPVPRRDVEEVLDMTEELLREENPLANASEVAHIEVYEKTKVPKKIKISDGTRTKPKVREYRVEPAFMSSSSQYEDDTNSIVKKEHATKNFYKDAAGKSGVNHSGSRMKKIMLGIGMIVVIVFFTLSNAFAHATVIIKNSENVETLTEVLLPQPVTYTALTKNKEKIVTIDNPVQVNIQKKAVGEVVLYNNFSTAPYELIASTRLQTANGSVYRLLNDIKIPGKKVVAGKSTPGSITTKVEADAPGDIYNARPGIELRIPGLIKGTGKYVNIYGKTANQFTGGQTGKTIDTSSQSVAAAIDEAKKQVGEQVISEFNQSNPEFMVLPDSIQITHSVGTVSTTDGASQIKVPITVKAIGLSKTNLLASLDSYFADKKIKADSASLNQLTFSVSTTENDTILKDKFNIKATGQVVVTPTVSGAEISEKIAGKKANIALEEMKSIVSTQNEVEIKIWPFWKNTVPNTPDKIEILFE